MYRNLSSNIINIFYQKIYNTVTYSSKRFYKIYVCIYENIVVIGVPYKVVIFVE